jgi:long-subunit acyl-CoA synthetase (AMP-forming)
VSDLITVDNLSDRIGRARIALAADVVAQANRTWILRIASCVDDIVLAMVALQTGRNLVLLDPLISEIEFRKKMTVLPSSYDLKTKVAIAGNSQIKIHRLSRLIMFTSGSLGEARAVQLSEGSIDENANSVITSLDLNEVKCQHLFLPLWHSFGFLGQLLPCLKKEIATHLYLDFGAFLRSGALSTGAGMLAGVPSHFEAMIRAMPAPNANFTHIVSAGGALSVPLRQKMREAFPGAVLYTNYGQTEAGPRILSLKSTEVGFFEGLDGRPVGHWQIRLGKEFELQVKGPQAMLGYTNKPLESEWLNTGDIAEISPLGLIQILGRRDDLVKISGERVSLLGLESEYKDILHLDNLAIIARPDALRGSVLDLVLEESAIASSEVQKLLAKYFEKNVLPSCIVRLNQLPRLTNGKIDRVSLKALIGGGY